MKQGLAILNFLTWTFAIFAIGVGNLQEAGEIGLLQFFALEGLFWALTGVCGWTVWRHRHEG